MHFLADATSVVDFTAANATVLATGTAAIGVGLGALGMKYGLRFGKAIFRALLG